MLASSLSDKALKSKLWKSSKQIIFKWHVQKHWKVLRVWAIDIQGRTCTILSCHGAQIGDIWVFPAIKITIIHQVPMYCILTVKIIVCYVAWCANIRGRILFACVSASCGRQNPNTPVWALWLTPSLHRAVCKVWELPCVSVVWAQHIFAYYRQILP